MLASVGVLLGGTGDEEHRVDLLLILRGRLAVKLLLML